MAVDTLITLGILGGVFDPPHAGHVALARRAVEHFRLERLLVLVVADPGHKQATTPAEARLELARLAFSEVPGAEVELDVHARTVDSLEVRKPVDAIFIVGADEFSEFPRWKRPDRVLELVRLGVAMRPGVPDVRVQDARARFRTSDRIVFFEMAPVPVSSSEVRTLVAAGAPIDELVPSKVAEAIARLGLYREAE